MDTSRTPFQPSTPEPARTPYIAVLVYETTGLPQPSYREDFVLLWATDESQARELAVKRGAHETFGYIGGAGLPLTQRLKHIVDVNRATEDDLTGHADLYSRHFSDYAAYAAFAPFLGGAIG